MDCTICGDVITLENCVNTECGHAFCKVCFWKWTKENNSCPLCRHTILANTEELKEQKFIRRMVEQRSELTRQIQHFQDKLKWLKNKVNTLGHTLNDLEDKDNTKTVFVSNAHLNRQRLESIYRSIRS